MPAFEATRPPVLSVDDLNAIGEAALRILAGVGVRVPSQGLRMKLRAAGFAERGDRIVIEPHHSREMLAQPHDTRPHRPDMSAPVRLYTLGYAEWEWGLSTGELARFTTESLTQAVRLIDAYPNAILPGLPGVATDAAPALQPIVQYWVGAHNLSRGCPPVDAKDRTALPYVMAMAEALGTPVRSLPIYVFSPLTLAGESLECVLEFRDRLDAVGIGSMVSLGCSAPIDVADAIAMSLAEAVGCAVLVRELTGLAVHWHLEVVPIDLRSMSMVFGSPENFLLQLACGEANAFFHGEPWSLGAGNALTNALAPGTQASLERASLMTAGALLGQRVFGAAGALSLDECFSAEQLIYDVEIVGHVQRLVDGLFVEPDVERCLSEVREGVRLGQFASHGRTVARHRETYHSPRVLNRRLLGAGGSTSPERMAEDARALARSLIASHDYHLPDDTAREVDAVLERAKVALG